MPSTELRATARSPSAWTSMTMFEMRCMVWPRAACAVTMKSVMASALSHVPMPSYSARQSAAKHDRNRSQSRRSMPVV
jgi:hypothetical protein